MLKMSSAIRLSKNLLLSIDVTEIDEVGVDGGGDHENKTVGRSLSKNSNRATNYLTPNARQAFIKLRQVFIKALILRHFHLECYIRIEINTLGYTIGGVLS